jgi:hypothetical protein
MGLLFTAAAHAGLAAGDITVTFRVWERPQVRAGGRYRVGELRLMVDRVREVRVGTITRADARRAGFPDRAAMLAYLARRPGGPVGDDATLWRIDFHLVEKDARDRDILADDAVLSADDVDEIERRLDRLDRASPHGPWTRATLRLIAERPGVVSTRLAEDLGRDRASFKLDVRKLKALGLTKSLEVGYELSPRGTAALASIGKRRGPHSKNVGTFSNS